MKKLLLFSVLISYVGSHIAAEAQKINSVNRYPAVIEKYMRKAALSDAANKSARAKRLRAHQKGEYPLQRENQTYDDFFRRAQQEIGIAEQDILPVKTAINGEMKPGVVAHVYNGFYIKVNPQAFDSKPYGAKRIVALHEAFHVKYHDTTLPVEVYVPLLLFSFAVTIANSWRKIYFSDSSKWLKFAGTVLAPVYAVGTNTGIFFGVSKCEDLANNFLWSFASVLIIGYLRKMRSMLGAQGKGVQVAKFLINRSEGILAKCAVFLMLEALFIYYFNRFIEFRADRDAVEFSQCYKCVEDYTNSWLSPDEYLTKAEKQVYIEHFKAENALCDHHRKNN